MILPPTAIMKLRADEEAGAYCFASGPESPGILLASGTMMVQLTRNEARVSEDDVHFARDLVAAAQEFLDETERRYFSNDAAIGWAAGVRGDP